jgi:hypothetical protein
MKLEGWAADYAAELLAPMGDRWAHVQGVVHQAHRAAAILPPEEQEVLVARPTCMTSATPHPSLLPACMRWMLPGTCAPSAMSGWLAWWPTTWPTTPAPEGKPNCAA